MSEYPTLRYIAINICQACLDGEGGECHTPGCAFWIHHVDKLPISPNVYTDVSHLASQLTALQRENERLKADERRLDWIIDNCRTEGGGKGFTVFIPIDTESLRDGIDAALQQAEE